MMISPQRLHGHPAPPSLAAIHRMLPGSLARAVQHSTAFSNHLDEAVACWPTTATSSRTSRSRLVDSLPPWRMGLIASVYLNRTFSPRPLNLLCHAVLVMSGAGLWYQVRCLCASGLRPGFPPAGCVDHARAPRSIASAFAVIPPLRAHRPARWRRPLCLLCRRCVASTPGERPTHQL